MRYSFIKDEIVVNPSLEVDIDKAQFVYQPYIVIEELELESWIEYQVKHIDNYNNGSLDNKDVYEHELIEARRVWMNNYPTGHRYSVKFFTKEHICTEHSSYATFEEALEVAKHLKRALLQ